MYKWGTWQGAISWCDQNASEDCSVIVLDWLQETHETVEAILKYERGTRCAFFRGLHTCQPR